MISWLSWQPSTGTEQPSAEMDQRLCPAQRTPLPLPTGTVLYHAHMPVGAADYSAILFNLFVRIFINLIMTMRLSYH
jgi:hypothetical protein